MQVTVPDHVPEQLVRTEGWYGLQDLNGDPNAALMPFFDGPPVIYIAANARNPYGTWLLIRLEDIQTAFTDTEHFTSHYISGMRHLGIEELLIPIEIDPPDHAKYRAFLAPHFSKQRLAELTPVMVAGVDRVIDTVIDAGECDAVPLGYKMMSAGWCALVGADYEKSDTYIRFLWEMTHQYDPLLRLQCAKDMLAVMEELYLENLGKTGEGLIAKFVNGTIDGRTPTKAECSGFILFMFLAGMDTMGSTASWILRHLAEHPETRAELADAPGKIPAFVEEILRRYATVTTNRFVKKDVRVQGVLLKEGDNVLLATQLACLDPAKFECPMHVDVARQERHLAFGAGPHFCIGAPVARAQLPILVKAWLHRIPDFRIAEGAALTAHFGDVFGLDSLPLVWH
jgi:cytochrome P450